MYRLKDKFAHILKIEILIKVLITTEKKMEVNMLLGKVSFASKLLQRHA